MELAGTDCTCPLSVVHPGQTAHVMHGSRHSELQTHSLLAEQGTVSYKHISNVSKVNLVKLVYVHLY